MSADAATVAEALGGAKRVRKGWVARCPAHNDRTPSLSLSDGERGQLVWHCHAGCDQKTVRSQLIKRGLYAPAAGKSADPDHIETVHTYRDEDGKHWVDVVRRDYPDSRPKWIRPRKPDGRLGLPTGPRPLYRLPELLARYNCPPVLVVEGEKVADAAAEMPELQHLAVTTSISGSKAAGHSDWSPLRSMEVLIWPDHDPAGFRYARDVASALKGQADVRFILVPQTFPQGWDLADPLPTGHTIESLLAEATNVLPEPEPEPEPAVKLASANGREPEPEPEDEALAEVRAAALDGDWDLVRALAKANEPRLEERIFRARSIQDIVELERYATPDIEAVPWITFHDAAELPRPESVIEQRDGGTGALLTKGEVLLLTGPGKVGKSSVTLGLALARHHALNSDYAWGTACGLQIRAGRTFIASYEDSPAWVGYRVSKHWGTSYDLQRKRVDAVGGQILGVGDYGDGGPIRWRNPEFRLDKNPPVLSDMRALGPIFGPPANEFGQRLTNALPMETSLWGRLWNDIGKDDLLIIDPAHKAFAGNTSDPVSVNAFVTALANEATARGASVVIVHHANKSARKKAGEAEDSYAGSAAWSDACRGRLAISELCDTVTLTCQAANHGPSGWKAELQRVPDTTVLEYLTPPADDADRPLTAPEQQVMQVAESRDKPFTTYQLQSLIPEITGRTKGGRHVQSARLTGRARPARTHRS